MAGATVLLTTCFRGCSRKILAPTCSNVLYFTKSDASLSTESSASLVGRDFLTLRDFQKSDIEQLIWTAKDLKSRYKENREVFQPLLGKSISMVFQKRSTRTRLSTETGMALLGGHAAFLGPDDVHLGVNETLSDSAKVLSRMSDLILARVYGQSDLDMLAASANVPVISGLSDLYHPLQILADFLTLQEYFGYLKRLKIAWVGDGNNVTHSLMIGCAKLGLELRIATPKGYEVDSGVLKDAVTFAGTQPSSKIHCTHDPMEAVYRADVIVTDTWISMGQEEEKAKRLKDFQGFQVNRKMVDEAAAKWVFLHCLPRKPYEVTDDVFADKNSLVFEEAENRKWTVMSVMLHLLQNYQPSIPKPVFEKD